MYIFMRKDIIDLLWKDIGKPFQNNNMDFERTGRIKYTTWIDKDTFIKCEYDDYEKKEIEERKKNMPEYDKDTPDIFLRIDQSYWIKDEHICASGFKFVADENNLNVILRQIYFLTDSFGEPTLEDTTKIEWELLNKKKIIILLPHTQGKFHTFSLLSGDIDFFNSSVVWKNGA